jgi:UPF0755 protein
MSRHRGRRIVFLLGLVATVVLAIGYLWIRSPRAPGSAERVVVEFPIGTPTRQIFRTLQATGVARDALLAEIYYRVFRHGVPLRAGEYSFSPGEPLDRAIDLLERGEVVRHVVVVPEGLTNAECFSLFVQQGIGTEQGFRRASREPNLLPGPPLPAPDLEGFLFPDTYVVTRSTPTREVLAAMVENFRRHFTPELRRRAESLGLNERQAVTVASLVEKETSLPEERPHVAAVYLNRLKLGMRLQCDPTVIYALQERREWTGKLRRSDLDVDSPYNTYLYAGLPPGPICNPGAAALEAAVNPSPSGDLYFVARGDGGHYFSRSYADHLLMIGKSRANAEANAEDEPPN